MNWIDAAVILMAVLAAVSGVRHGMVVAVCAFAGVILGAVGGVLLAPALADLVDAPNARLLVGLAVVLGLVVLGEVLGVYLGRSIKRRMTSPKLSWVDNVLGGVVQGLAVFVVTWLIALPLTSAGTVPWLAGAVNQSRVLGAVDAVMPPAARALPDELRRLLDGSGFPGVLEPFSRTPVAQVEPPDPALQNSRTVQTVRESVVKVHGTASSCSRVLNGSGFVVAPQRVMTNAHVVAGAEQVSIEVGEARLPATVVLYDPESDIAVLDVPDFFGTPLEFVEAPAAAEDNGIVLGYPLGGDYRASAARVRQLFNLRGPDIYDSTTVTREVYTVRSDVRSGNSGGPLIDVDGRVLGMVFGAAVDDEETGFVLTNEEIADEVAAAPGLTRPVDTGGCSS
ncbi:MULTISPECIES: MarP family serine protease [Actinoalloteichus]|uniref:Trypsin-like peptidase domain/Colicin V production protein n=1 Tax=Actinoalloteichus fjordicus TaxID=1612552 RepID=A0AAC9L8I6_9PSEU|nr:MULTISPECIES: MarP family serine protease [Actinoalloteichus]APU12345.1 Trypsin-like peptidase domain/Colicin V production protein [Actinoalloteichus fjordicus]APU18297.1 Trypsin-like peptidase domain/Colicin V production protein [Actinoalloteichus sp. GBA129-24]